MRLLKNTIAIGFVTIFLIMGSIGILAMSGHHHEPGCPFMLGEQTICQMDAFDHISAWQSAFTTTLPTLVVLMLFAVAVFVAWKHYNPPNPSPPKVSSVTRNRQVRISVIQELFSSGILNPRAP